MRSSNCGANKTEWNRREDGQKGAFSQTSRRDSTETNKFSNGGERVGRDDASVSPAFEERNTRQRVFMNVAAMSSSENGSRISISYGAR